MSRKRKQFYLLLHFSLRFILFASLCSHFHSTFAKFFVQNENKRAHSLNTQSIFSFVPYRNVCARQMYTYRLVLESYWTILIWSYKIFYGNFRVGVAAWMNLTVASCMRCAQFHYLFMLHVPKYTDDATVTAVTAADESSARQFSSNIILCFSHLPRLPFHSFCLLWNNNKFKA